MGDHVQRHGSPERRSIPMRVWSNGMDTVVAPDLDAVQKIVEAQHGTTFEDEGWTLDEWFALDDDRLLTISNFDGNEGKLALTASEWVLREGEGFLCSTEF